MPREVAAAIPQQIAIASYIYPTTEDADGNFWNRLISYPKEKVSVLIANVVNGPDTSVNIDWKQAITSASAAGKLRDRIHPNWLLRLEHRQIHDTTGLY